MLSGKKFVDSICAHDNKGKVHFRADIDKIRVVLGYHFQLSHDLGDLVGVVLHVPHHEVVLLRDDVARYVDVRGKASSAHLLQVQRRLQSYQSIISAMLFNNDVRLLTLWMNMSAQDSHCIRDCFFMVAYTRVCPSGIEDYQGFGLIVYKRFSSILINLLFNI